MDLSYIIIPLIVVVSSQAIKLATDSIKGNFSLKHIFVSYGGMPSSHTAFVTSVMTLVALREGLNTAAFAVAMVFGILVIRDALAFRNFLGQQAKILNQLAKESKLKGVEPMRERMGHSLVEVGVGAIFGIVITWALNLL